MKIESEKDFFELRKKIQHWKKQFPMFHHDVDHIESIIEEHIKQHSLHLINHRQSHKRYYLEKAEEEIKFINNVVAIAEKMELIAILSQ